MNNIEASKQLLQSGAERIAQSKKIIALHRFENHEGIQAINKSIDKVIGYKVNGAWVNSHYENQYHELTAMRDRIIDKDFPELKSYFDLAKK